MGRSSTGLTEYTAGLLCYVAGWISGIVFLLLERESNFVRFHAVQSILVFGVLSAASSILGPIPWLGLLIRIALGIVMFILWIFLMVKAGRGERYKIRWAGDFAEKWVGG